MCAEEVPDKCLSGNVPRPPYKFYNSNHPNVRLLAKIHVKEKGWLNIWFLIKESHIKVRMNSQEIPAFHLQNSILTNPGLHIIPQNKRKKDQ